MSVIQLAAELDSRVTPETIVYSQIGATERRLELYRPVPNPNQPPPPIVIFVFGFPDELMLARRGRRLKDSAQYQSWAQLTAAAGCAAVTYETEQPSEDLGHLVSFLQQNAADLGLNGARIALWACSGNVPTAVVTLMEQPESFQAAVLYYGPTLDEPGSTIVATAAREAGFANPGAGRTYDDLPTDLPILLVRAGQDYPPLNTTIDEFAAAALARNLPLTLINYATGQHGFDLHDDSPPSRQIIQQTVSFLAGHLKTGANLYSSS